MSPASKSVVAITALVENTQNGIKIGRIGKQARSGSQPNCRFSGRNLERAKGFEPSTPTLARLCSTPELRPLWRLESGDVQRVRRAISRRFQGPQALYRGKIALLFMALAAHSLGISRPHPT